MAQGCGEITMEIIDKTKDKKEEQWQLGDVVTDDINYGLVITDDCSNYMVLNFKGNNQYTTDQTSSYDSIEELQDYYPSWHKVNAKLVIE